MEEVRKIEGSGYCCPTTGFFDGLFNFLQKSLIYVKLRMFIFYKISQLKSTKDTKRLNNLLINCEESGLADSTIQMLINLNQKSDISPKGLISLLSFLHDAIHVEFNSFGKKLFQENSIRLLSGLMKEAQLLAIQEWPLTYGGGLSCVHLVVAQVLRIFNSPYHLIVIKLY